MKQAHIKITRGETDFFYAGEDANAFEVQTVEGGLAQGGFHVAYSKLNKLLWTLLRGEKKLIQGENNIKSVFEAVLKRIDTCKHYDEVKGVSIVYVK